MYDGKFVFYFLNDLFALPVLLHWNHFFDTLTEKWLFAKVLNFFMFFFCYSFPLLRHWGDLRVRLCETNFLQKLKFSFFRFFLYFSCVETVYRTVFCENDLWWNFWFFWFSNSILLCLPCVTPLKWLLGHFCVKTMFCRIISFHFNIYFSYPSCVTSLRRPLG